MKLSDWMQLHNITDEVLANQIGTHRLSVRRYRKGERKPKDEILMKIISVTDGAVDANDFVKGNPLNGLRQAVAA